MFLIGNQKPAVKTVFGSFLDKDEHEKIEDITYTRVVCCSAGAPQEEHHRQKTATCFVVFPDDSSLPKQKQRCSQMIFHNFPSSIENIWYLQCFPKNYPNMFQGMVFPQLVQFAPEKTWYSQPARKINAGFCKYQCFFLVC